jgi:hypothetical protein
MLGTLTAESPSGDVCGDVQLWFVFVDTLRRRGNHRARFIKRVTSKDYVAVVFSSNGIYRVYKNEEEFCKVQYIHQVQNA